MPVRIESQAEPIPGYRLVERLGGGGFGEVWKAVAPGGLLKAIKFVYGDLQTGDDEDGVRAEQELKALSRVKTVRHPYILSLERYDIVEGQLLIVMELADRNLWDRFRECQNEGLPGIPRDELLGYLEEIAEALDLMNREFQLQHLDIKPQNLFLVHNHIKVADFGSVKDLEGMVASVTGGVTPVYAAPETFDGWVSRFCDQYSLAIVYQELLTGRRPFTGSTVRQLVMQHLQGIPDLSPLPSGDKAAIRRALSKNPEERHPNCQLFVQALREAQPDKKEGTTRKDKEFSEAAAASPSALLAPPLSQKGPVTRWIRDHDESQSLIGRTQLNGSDEVRKVHRTKVDMVGDGVLFPALVIGLGQMGLGVLRQVSHQLTERFDSPEALPNIRFLYIDTDPECVRLATAGPGTLALRRSDVLRAPLFRPSHYLKPRDGKVRVDSWLHPKMLYRIPRQAFSAGVRALGRLAFVDNQRTIALRLRSELEECVDPEALAEAVRRSGLCLRTNRPRIYLVTSLAGGTGSGMFLDLAYVARALLKKMGGGNPEVVGVLLLPRVESGPAHATGVGNAYAALTELSHFSAPGNVFSANYDTQDTQVLGPISDPDAPFSRCIVLPMPSAAESGKVKTGAQNQAAVGRPAPSPLAFISHFLVSDLTTSLGRCADVSRRERQASAGRPGLSCQTFGMHHLAWPRRALLQDAGRRLCTQLVTRWMSKDPAGIRARVSEWVSGQWTCLELGPEQVIAALQQGCEQALGNAPESAFASLIDPIATWQTTHPGKELEQPAVFAALGQLEQWLGKPPQPAPKDKTRKPGGGMVKEDELRTAALVLGGAEADPVLEEALRQKAEELTDALGQKLAEVAASLIEQPGLRLAGAEEVIRQMTQMLERALRQQEDLAGEIAGRTLAACEGIATSMKALQAATAGKGAASARRAGWWGGGGDESLTPSRLGNLLRQYAKGRYQGLVLQRVVAIYVSLRGQLSDQMREVGFCRNRLGELCHSLAVVPTSTRGLSADEETPPAFGEHLFQPGCSNLEAAVRQLLEQVSPEDVASLDRRLESVIREQFTALVHVCLASSNLLKNLAVVMRQEAEQLLNTKLMGASVVDMYRRRAQLLNPSVPAPEPEPDQRVESLIDSMSASNRVPLPAPPRRSVLQLALAEALEQAGPELNALVAPGRLEKPSEVVIVSAPHETSDGSQTPSLREQAQELVADHSIIVTDGHDPVTTDEILFYREEACLTLADLKLLGPVGREAYRQMNNVEHFTPHTRIDITEWFPAGSQ
jgi:serine/threonine protein kinase